MRGGLNERKRGIMLELEIWYIKNNNINELDIDYFDVRNEPLLNISQVFLKKMRKKFPKYSSLYIIFYENLTEEEKKRIRIEHGEKREYYFKETNINELISKKDLEFLRETLKTLKEGLIHSKFRECLSDDEINKFENYVYEKNFIYTQNIDIKNNKTKTRKAVLKGVLTSGQLNLFLEIRDLKARKSIYEKCVFELPPSVIPSKSGLNPIDLYGYELYWENDNTIDIIINTVGNRLRTKIYQKSDASVLTKQQRIKS
jgi:hypothetical protein